MSAAISLSGSTPENRLPAAASDLQGLENVGALVDLDAHDLAARCGVVAARMGVERFAGDSPNRHAARRDFRQVVVSDLKRAFGQRGARGNVGKGPKRHRVQLALELSPLGVKVTSARPICYDASNARHRSGRWRRRGRTLVSAAKAADSVATQRAALMTGRTYVWPGAAWPGRRAPRPSPRRHAHRRRSPCSA